ncbi:hypothetical protein HK105_207441 [Polyrhizophydium stewartii]|uniref:Uncharacterized protein n=1 Tax=Polyrhizophydium stewartii TaxID=2732419 RepID=A0ABR4N0W3_9FUNG
MGVSEDAARNTALAKIELLICAIVSKQTSHIIGLSGLPAFKIKTDQKKKNLEALADMLTKNLLLSRQMSRPTTLIAYLSVGLCEGLSETLAVTEVKPADFVYMIGIFTSLEKLALNDGKMIVPSEVADQLFESFDRNKNHVVGYAQEAACLLRTLPRPNQHVLIKLLQFCYLVSARSPTPGLQCKALAYLVTPCVLDLSHKAPSAWEAFEGLVIHANWIAILLNQPAPEPTATSIPHETHQCGGTSQSSNDDAGRVFDSSNECEGAAGTSKRSNDFREGEDDEGEDDEGESDGDEHTEDASSEGEYRNFEAELGDANRVADGNECNPSEGDASEYSDDASSEGEYRNFEAELGDANRVADGNECNPSEGDASEYSDDASSEGEYRNFEAELGDANRDTNGNECNPSEGDASEHTDDASSEGVLEFDAKQGRTSSMSSILNIVGTLGLSKGLAGQSSNTDLVPTVKTSAADAIHSQDCEPTGDHGPALHGGEEFDVQSNTNSSTADDADSARGSTESGVCDFETQALCTNALDPMVPEHLTGDDVQPAATDSELVAADPAKVVVCQTAERFASFRWFPVDGTVRTMKRRAGLHAIPREDEYTAAAGQLALVEMRAVQGDSFNTVGEDTAVVAQPAQSVLKLKFIAACQNISRHGDMHHATIKHCISAIPLDTELVPRQPSVATVHGRMIASSLPVVRLAER